MITFKKDKYLHFYACFVATVLVAAIQGGVAGAWFAFGLAIGKEYGDSKAKGNKWDWFDLLADILGIIVALLMLFIVKKIKGSYA